MAFDDYSNCYIQMNVDQPLHSLHVLVTRPAGLAEPLCAEIQKRGGFTTHFPVIEILTPDNAESLQQAIETVNSFDIALFISPTTVKQTAKHISLTSLTPTIGAIGDATCSALQKEKLVVQIKPEGHNSESLLEHPLLQSDSINNKRIIIFKGEGGRELLTDTLTTRGASVFIANVYKRDKPKHYTPLTKLELSNVNAILVSSGEGITNLFNMAEAIDDLTSVQLIVPGERCAKIAKDLGFKSIVTTANATNASFIDTLCEINRQS